MKKQFLCSVILYLSLLLTISCVTEHPVKKENIKSYIGRYAGYSDLYYFADVDMGKDSITGETIWKTESFIDQEDYHWLIIEIEADSATKLPYVDAGKVLTQLDWFYNEDFPKPIKLFLDDKGVVKLDTTFYWRDYEPSKYSLRIDVDSANIWLNGTYFWVEGGFKLNDQDSLILDPMQVPVRLEAEKATLIKNPKYID